MAATLGVVPDPLGAQLYVTDSAELPRWNSTSVPEYDILVDDPENMKISPFSWDDVINKKIILW